MLDQVAESIRAAQTFNGIPPDRYLVSQLSLGKLLADRALQVPDKVFLTYYDDDLDDLGIGAKFTYAEFNDLVLRIANWLSGTLGIKAGDCVGLLSHNHPHAAAAQFACWRIGAVIAPQNAHEDDARIAFILADAECKVLLYLPEFTGRAKAIAATMTGLESICELADPGVMVVSSQYGKRIDLTSGEDFRPLPALLVYTSGTTGNPKGVLLTQYNLLINALGTCQWHRIDETQRLMCVLPIHHVNGIVVTLVTPLVAGSSVVLNKAFKARTFWKRLAAERIAIVSTVPTILQFLCEANEDIGKLDLNAFRYPICGAGTLAISLAERFEKQFSFPVMHAYGLSETTAFVCSMPVDLSSGEHRKWITTHGYPSIGAAFPHVEMAIHDDQGSTLGAGQRGEIVVRGHYIMAGYFHRPDANAETFKHGWFRAGDEGFFEPDEKGRPFYFITGRIKELINRGGVKYSPFEIEEILLRLPGVNVGLAIAFDNEWYGEEVGAYVVKVEGASVTEEQVLSHCRAHMPFEKCPKVVVFGSEVPVTVTGKYQRLRLKPLYAEHFHTQFRAQ